MSDFQKHTEEMKNLCKQYRVKTLYVFGSVLTTRFNDSSDIDFVVRFWDMRSEDYADNYYGLKSALESMFKRPVDLLEEQTLKNPYLLSTINSSKRLVYG
jgi:predicted nucleotidyltransferase